MTSAVRISATAIDTGTAAATAFPAETASGTTVYSRTATTSAYAPPVKDIVTTRLPTQAWSSASTTVPAASCPKIAGCPAGISPARSCVS